ncbi:MAG TPA: DUF6365 family protein [Haliangiales bacterium]|nr:DUF6365 family protein [Haliangiales bacterium]
MKRHLFVTFGRQALGEAVAARRIAEDLAREGDQIVCLAPREHAPALAGAGFKVGIITPVAARCLDAVVRDTLRAERCDSLCLADLTAMALTCDVSGIPVPAFLPAGVSVVGIDLWEVRDADRRYDVHGRAARIDAAILDVPAMRPVPVVRPTAPGAYDALPPPAPPAERAAVRAEMGLSADGPIVLLPTSAWQNVPPAHAAVAAVPALLTEYVAAAGVTLAHVGPAPLPGGGPGYMWIPPLASAQYRRLLAACDALLTLNLTQMSVGAAIADGVPVIGVVSTLSPDAARPGPLLRAWASGVPPLPPFYAWPIGFREFLRPALDGNPLLDAIATCELLDEDALVGTLRRVVRDPGEALARQARYAAMVRALPRPAAAYRRLSG